jgi:hypothetical protein
MDLRRVHSMEMGQCAKNRQFVQEAVKKKPGIKKNRA